MKALKYVFATIIVLCIVFVAGAFALINYALSTSDRNRTLSYEYMERTYPETRPWMDSLNAAHAMRDTFVVLSTGNRQHAIFVANPKAHGRTALLVHGYECDAAKMIHIAHLYERVLGYNVLIPDLYGHGMSDGDVAQMGWKDRLDIEDWLRRAPSVFHTPADSMRLVLHGISMGAATTMCVSGDPTPSYVRCFIEDCGYTSVWDEYSQEMKKRFGLPEFPMLHITSALVKARYGWSFKEASPLNQVAKCRKPMLFIHGSNDKFVPTAMVRPLYEAKPGKKALWIAAGSEHAVSYKDHKAEYTRRVADFLRYNL